MKKKSWDHWLCSSVQRLEITTVQVQGRYFLWLAGAPALSTFFKFIQVWNPFTCLSELSLSCQALTWSDLVPKRFAHLECKQHRQPQQRKKQWDCQFKKGQPEVPVLHQREGVLHFAQGSTFQIRSQNMIQDFGLLKRPIWMRSDYNTFEHARDGLPFLVHFGAIINKQLINCMIPQVAKILHDSWTSTPLLSHL